MGQHLNFYLSSHNPKNKFGLFLLVYNGVTVVQILYPLQINAVTLLINEMVVSTLIILKLYYTPYLSYKYIFLQSDQAKYVFTQLILIEQLSLSPLPTKTYTI